MIHETGYWEKQNALQHHIHSPGLGAWICKFLEEYKNQLVIDFGCGMGDYLNTLQVSGFKELIGIEVEPPKMYEKFDIISQNLINPFSLNKAGSVICLEVGEHIPKEYQETLLNNITEHCNNYLILSWAIKGQGGYGHVNELDNQVVIEQLEKRGFVYLEQPSIEARGVVEDYCSYFRNTIMVFKK